MSRIARLQASFADAEIGGLLVTNPSNIRYLTGFTGSAGMLFVGASGATLVTDSRYALRAPAEIEASGAPSDVVISPGRDLTELVSLAKTTARVGLEADHVSWSQAERFATSLPGEAVSTSGVVEALREFKDADEIAAIERAAAIADAALAEVQPLLADLPTERRFGAELDAAMRRLGADRPGFETIVAAGNNSARPHHQPSDTQVGIGDLVVVDFGAEKDGYRSDMTRSFVIGTPTERQNEILNAVHEAQQAGVDAAGPGVATADVDRACRDRLGAAGLGEWFTHGTGHGVGIDIHEAPSVSARGTATLAPGHIITVEPGAYIPDFGGVRWEDTLVITNTGSRPLTNAVKQPVVEPNSAQE
jgi:Xaa-Pro aminopeptidase